MASAIPDAPTYGYLPSRWGSPPFDRCQIILLGDRGTCANRLLPDGGAGVNRIGDLNSSEANALTVITRPLQAIRTTIALVDSHDNGVT